MHFLLTLPILSLLCLVLPKKGGWLKYSILVAVVILCNLPIFNHLSLCDLVFSLTSGFSLFGLIVCALFLMQNLSSKSIAFIGIQGCLFYILVGVCVLCSFLDFLPFELYYLDPRLTVILIFIVIVVAYFFDFILASLLVLSLFGYALALFDYSNAWDYLFDLPSLVVFVILSLAIMKNKAKRIHA